MKIRNFKIQTTKIWKDDNGNLLKQGPYEYLVEGK